MYSPDKQMRTIVGSSHSRCDEAIEEDVQAFLHMRSRANPHMLLVICCPPPALGVCSSQLHTRLARLGHIPPGRKPSWLWRRIRSGQKKSL
ncbi:unnamed protein product [Protopolystoma xenopodis]|uniref:Uncharacterized protein n=1 Tax=Protopolystoma xenopodis TaxID=117903 RepID=A0A3S5CIZ4_9PLAT|nr:unnamed protein product [Protopolystoma xenopodis]